MWFGNKCIRYFTLFSIYFSALELAKRILNVLLNRERYNRIIVEKNKPKNYLNEITANDMLSKIHDP